MHVVATSIDKYHISSSTAREECEMDTLYKTNIHAVRMFLQFISATETTSKTTIVGTSLSPESAVSLTTAVWFHYQPHYQQYLRVRILIGVQSSTQSKS